MLKQQQHSTVTNQIHIGNVDRDSTRAIINETVTLTEVW